MKKYIILLLFLQVTIIYSQYIEQDEFYKNFYKVDVELRDDNGSSFEICRPPLFTDTGFKGAVQGNLDTSVAITKPLTDPNHRFELYTDLFFNFATMPILSENYLKYFDEASKELARQNQAISNKNNIILSAIDIASFMNLKYVRGDTDIAKFANAVKVKGRLLKRTSNGTNFKVLGNILTAINIVNLGSEIFKSTAMYTALYNDEAIARLDALLKLYEYIPNTDPQIIKALHKVRAQLVLSEDDWKKYLYALDKALSVHKHEIINTSFGVASKVLALEVKKIVAAKIGIAAGAKASVLVATWAIPVAVIAEGYLEISSTSEQYQYSILAGEISYSLNNLVKLSSSILDEDEILAIKGIQNYALYEYYYHMDKSFDGVFPSVTTLFYKDYSGFKEHYEEMESNLREYFYTGVLGNPTYNNENGIFPDVLVTRHFEIDFNSNTVKLKVLDYYNDTLKIQDKEVEETFDGIALNISAERNSSIIEIRLMVNTKKLVKNPQYLFLIKNKQGIVLGRYSGGFDLSENFSIVKGDIPATEAINSSIVRLYSNNIQSLNAKEIVIQESRIVKDNSSQNLLDSSITTASSEVGSIKEFSFTKEVLNYIESKYPISSIVTFRLKDFVINRVLAVSWPDRNNIICILGVKDKTGWELFSAPPSGVIRSSVILQINKEYFNLINNSIGEKCDLDVTINGSNKYGKFGLINEIILNGISYTLDNWGPYNL